MTNILACPFCGHPCEVESQFGREWWVSCTNIEGDCHASDAVVHASAAEAITHWNRRAPLPEGYVLVPKEPTVEMSDAAERAEFKHLLEDRRRGGHDPQLGYRAIYRAMISVLEKKNDR